MLLGLASAFEPFLEHNQGPRTTYAGNMLSQAIGFGPMTAGVSGPSGSMEKSAYRLWYPQRPMCTTIVEDSLNLPPIGQTMLVAVWIPLQHRGLGRHQQGLPRSRGRQDHHLQDGDRGAQEQSRVLWAP